MEYFNSLNTTHEITFLPRYYASDVDVHIHDEQINSQTELTGITATTVDEFLNLEFDFEFIKDRAYQIEVIGSDGLIFRCKAKGI